MTTSTLTPTRTFTSISVIIPTARGGEPLRRALRSCLRQELEGESCEIIVVANPPSPAIDRLVEELRVESPGVPIQVHGQDRRGANAARNLGIRVAGGDLLLFLDDDCELPGVHHFRDRLAAHNRDPRLAGIGGPYLSPDGGPRSCSFYNSMQRVWIEANRDRQGEQLVLLGGNASYRRDIFSTCGTFDESLTYGGTETEFNHRLVLARQGISYRDDLSVVHHFEGGWGSIFRRAWKQGQGRGNNPHQARIEEMKDREARTRALKENGGNRGSFLAFLAIYKLLVSLGARFRR